MSQLVGGQHCQIGHEAAYPRWQGGYITDLWTRRHWKHLKTKGAVYSLKVLQQVTHVNELSSMDPLHQSRRDRAKGH